MNLDQRYDIECPACGETTFLLERNLQRIVDSLQEIDRVSLQLAFVCLRCKIAFHYDYPNRRSGAMTDLPVKIPIPWACIWTTGCGDKHCGSPVELVAVRRAGTTEEQFRGELEVLTQTKFSCEKDHPFVAPGSIRQL